MSAPPPPPTAAGSQDPTAAAPVEPTPAAPRPEEVIDDSDSAFESLASSTTSISDSIRDYRKIHGRTYHAYGDTEYWGPNDESQNESHDIGHHMFTLLFDGKLFLAPIPPNPQKVIDVGTGTGIWAIDFADAYPSAKVIGTDLSPTQPTWVPPNIVFEVEDAQQPWNYGENENGFDFVHMRALMGSIADWPKLYADIFRSTKPGGWFEHVEFDIAADSDDGSVKPGHIIYDWTQTFIGAGEKMGRTFKIGPMSKKLMEEAGFVDVVEQVWKVPTGPWSSDPKFKEIGRWQLLYLNTGLEGMALYILKNVLGWEYTEIQAYIGEMQAALKNWKENHAYNRIICVYGRKPESSA